MTDAELVAPHVRPPGDLWRFSVGSPGAHGTTWALTCERRTTDVYLSTREHGGGDSKWSFHASGDWRLQYSKPKAEELGISRVLSQRQRPRPNAYGFTEMTRILIPTDDIPSGAKELTRLTKVEWIDPAPPGMMTGIMICVAEPGVQPRLGSDLVPLRFVELPDGSVVMMLRFYSQILPAYYDHFERTRESVRKMPVPGGGEWGAPRTDPNARALSDSLSAEGRHEIWDLWI